VWKALRKWLDRFFRRRRPVSVPEIAPVPKIVELCSVPKVAVRRSVPEVVALRKLYVELAANPMPPPSPPVEEPIQRPSRHQRRRLSALERARRRLDVFVTPGGTPPDPKPHQHASSPTPPSPSPTPPSPGIIDETLTDNGRIIYDTTKTGEDVLVAKTEMYGEFNFRDTILDQLDRYWVYLERMKIHDK